jgi:hypothetical protein
MRMLVSMAMLTIVAALAPVALGRYFAYVVLILLTAGWILLLLVFAQRSPRPGSDPAALAATGGSGV